MIVLLQKYSVIPQIGGLLFCLLISPTQAQTANETEKLVTQWINIERQTAALQDEWQQQQPLLLQRLDLLAAENEQLQSVLNKSQGNNSEVDQQRAKLLAEQTTLEVEQQQTESFLDKLTIQLQVLEAQLPPVLLSSWQQQSMAVDATADTSNQLQVALAKLSKLMEFSQRIVLNEASITSPEGQQIMVKQLYLGVSMAWFASADQSYAGVGFATDNGWQWQFKPDVDKAQIAKAIAIYEKQQQAEFVQLSLPLNRNGAGQ
ncbi:DUF3450 family protein [Alteromonadaceae bacterium BrNp21-10]|nr:DUF3450 family protein [Alteromonadaceae bacterium BrNp21-10]